MSLFVDFLWTDGLMLDGLSKTIAGSRRSRAKGRRCFQAFAACSLVEPVCFGSLSLGVCLGML